MTPQQIMYLIYALYGIISFESLVLVFILWKTPALAFLKAGLLKRPLMYIIGKDHMGLFKSFTPKNGAANIGGVGLFHLTENSHTLEAGAKIPIYFAFRDLAATLLPEYPAIIQEIRQNGFLVNNLDDVSGYIDKIKTGTIENYPIKVKSYKTYKFHDLANMFPFNLDPTFIDSTVQCEVAKFTKMMKMGPIAIGTVVVVVLVIALAVFIIQRAYKGTIGIGECKTLCEVGSAAVQTVAAQAAATVVNTNPIA